MTQRLGMPARLSPAVQASHWLCACCRGCKETWLGLQVGAIDLAKGGQVLPAPTSVYTVLP